MCPSSCVFKERMGGCSRTKWVMCVEILCLKKISLPHFFRFWTGQVQWLEIVISHWLCYYYSNMGEKWWLMHSIYFIMNEFTKVWTRRAGVDKIYVWSFKSPERGSTGLVQCILSNKSLKTNAGWIMNPQVFFSKTLRHASMLENEF